MFLVVRVVRRGRLVVDVERLVVRSDLNLTALILTCQRQQSPDVLIGQEGIIEQLGPICPLGTDWAQLQEALFPRAYNLHMAFCDGLQNRKGLI